MKNVAARYEKMYLRDSTALMSANHLIATKDTTQLLTAKLASVMEADAKKERRWRLAWQTGGIAVAITEFVVIVYQIFKP